MTVTGIAIRELAEDWVRHEQRNSNRHQRHRTGDGQWHLLTVLLPCNMLASLIARTISRKLLYPIASPEPVPEDKISTFELNDHLGDPTWSEFEGKPEKDKAMIENFRIRVFRAVAQHLNFSRAVEELLLTQPAVT